MSEYSEKAMAIHKLKEHHNCAQSVACAFCEHMGIDHDTAKRITKMYGGGAKGTCGAVMGARAVLNYMNGIKNEADPAADNYVNSARFNKIKSEFIKKNQTDQCRELKKLGLRSCNGCVEDAALILEEMIRNGEAK